MAQIETKYLVCEYTVFIENGEIKESTAIYKYSDHLQALRTYHNKLSGACVNQNYISETVVLMNAAGQTIYSENIPVELYRNEQPTEE